MSAIIVDGIECDEHEAMLYVVGFEAGLMAMAQYDSAIDACVGGEATSIEKQHVTRSVGSAANRATHAVRAWRIAKRMRGGT